IEISPCYGLRPMFLHHLIHPGHGWLSQDAGGGDHGFEFFLSDFIGDKEHLILPIDQHVTDASLDERSGGAARARVQYGHVFVEAAHKVLRFGLIFGAPDLKSPGAQIIPARTAGSLWVRRDHSHAWLDEVVPVLDAFGIAFA